MGKIKKCVKLKNVSYLEIFFFLFIIYILVLKRVKHFDFIRKPKHDSIRIKWN